MTPGLTLYDVLGARHDGGWHRRLDVDGSLEIWPALRRPGLRGGLLYHDGVEDDARFALAVLRTAIASDAAPVAVTRMRATGLRPDASSGPLRVVTATDVLQGGELEIRTRSVVDATGVWAAEPDHPFASPSMRLLPSRGAHLVVARDRIPATCRVDDPGPWQGRVLHPVARSLADRHDRRTVRRAAGSRRRERPRGR